MSYRKERSFLYWWVESALLCFSNILPLLLCGVLAACLVITFSPGNAASKTIRVGILKASDIRNDPIKGLQKGLSEHAMAEDIVFEYQILDAAGDRSKLLKLAEDIIYSKPDVAVAAGGVEADALLKASGGSGVPVVFLSVSSPVARGVVADMVSSGNNFTGIDTNDSKLTAKRIWFIKKMLPDAKKIFIFHVPSIVPSVQSLAIARQAAEKLGFELQVADVESEEDIEKAAAGLSKSSTDVILQFPLAPTDRTLHSIIFPRAMAEKIPIFGCGEGSMQRGAVASYAGSRYANGYQATRLIHKIIHGIAPKDIPIETPEKLELIINKDLVAKLGLKLPGRVYKMADKIVDLQF